MATDKMSHYRIESVPQMEILMPLVKEALAAGQSIRFSPTGTSMLPMLRQGIDSVELSGIPGKLRKYDLPLYQRDDGKYVLHRIVEVSDCYTCMGDNQFRPEKGVRQDQLIAVVTAFYRGEVRYTVDHAVYKLYCLFWYYSRFARCFVNRLYNWIRRQLTRFAGRY